MSESSLCDILCGANLEIFLLSTESTPMASIALHQTRALFPALRSPWTIPAIAAALLPTFLASQRPFNWGLQSLLDLLPPFLLAVPKKKVSHSRKAMRSANKGLKDKRSTRICLLDHPGSEAFSSRYCQLPSLRSTKTSASSMCRLLLFSHSEVEIVCTVCESNSGWGSCMKGLFFLSVCDDVLNSSL